MQSDANEAILAAERIERIAQLESEIETKRAEIERLQNHAKEGRANNDVDENEDESNDPENKSQPLHILLGRFMVLRSGAKKEIPTTAPPNNDPIIACHSTNIDDPPALVYTTTWETDDETITSSTNATPSPPYHRRTNGLIQNLLRPFAFPRRDTKTAAELDVLVTMIRKRDIRIESLEAIISSDVDIIEEMKDTIKNLVSERKDSTL